MTIYNQSPLSQQLDDTLGDRFDKSGGVTGRYEPAPRKRLITDENDLRVLAALAANSDFIQKYMRICRLANESANRQYLMALLNARQCLAEEYYPDMHYSVWEKHLLRPPRLEAQNNDNGS